MSEGPSLAGRAVAAILLTIGFYALALGLAGGLLFLAFEAVLHLSGYGLVQALIACLGGAGVILWSVLPEEDRFAPPGPALERERQPRLFELVDEVAAASGQAGPEEVYLVADVNAWVAQRGGRVGLGSRRMMGLGLPLLQAVTRTQLRAVLAHEFGHFHGGDTALGPWVYRTRAAIGRTIANLGETSRILQKPFLWYGSLFLRVTHAISRQQELAADRLACAVAGAPAQAAALRAIHGAAAAFDSYWGDEVVPVLCSGYRPPLAEGFRRFLDAPVIRAAVAESVREASSSAKADPYDTHPPLAERLAALAEETAAPAGAADDPPAISLLADADAMEGELVEFVVEMDEPREFRLLSWEAVGERVVLPGWRAFVRRSAAALDGVTPAGIPQAARHPEAMLERLGAEGPTLCDDEERRSWGEGLLGCALGVALAADGWTLESPVGEPYVLRNGASQVRPLEAVREAVVSAEAAGAWSERCAAVGLAEVDLGAMARALPAPS